MIQADPAGRFVLHADLGLDQILVWRFDEQQGVLTPNQPPAVSLPPGWRCSPRPSRRSSGPLSERGCRRSSTVGSPSGRRSVHSRSASTPLRRTGKPIEVAYGVLFLASDEASFITGTELVIDGGFIAQ